MATHIAGPNAHTSTTQNQAKNRRSAQRRESGMSVEEATREQERLLAEARLKYQQLASAALPQPPPQ